MGVFWFDSEGGYLGESGPDGESQYLIRAFVSYATPPIPPEPDRCCDPVPIATTACPPTPLPDPVYLNSKCHADDCVAPWLEGVWGQGQEFWECEDSPDPPEPPEPGPGKRFWRIRILEMASTSTSGDGTYGDIEFWLTEQDQLSTPVEGAIGSDQFIGPEDVFDGDPETIGYSSYTNEWVGYDFDYNGGTAWPAGYVIVASEGYPEEVPTRWALEVSDDGATWDLVQNYEYYGGWNSGDRRWYSIPPEED